MWTASSSHTTSKQMRRLPTRHTQIISNSYAQYVNNTYLICEKKLPAAKPDEAEKSGARVLPSDPALLRPLVPPVVLYSPTPTASRAFHNAGIIQICRI